MFVKFERISIKVGAKNNDFGKLKNQNSVHPSEKGGWTNNAM